MPPELPLRPPRRAEPGVQEEALLGARPVGEVRQLDEPLDLRGAGREVKSGPFFTSQEKYLHAAVKGC